VAPLAMLYQQSILQQRQGLCANWSALQTSAALFSIATKKILIFQEECLYEILIC